jgi:hypothetical protein
MINYIKNSSEKILLERKQFSVFDSTVVLVKDKPTNGIRLPTVFKKLQSSVPVDLVRDLDAIYIGQFEELLKRQIESFFLDGAIFITNDQINEEKMISTLLHEIAHCVEKTYTQEIYMDGKLKKEFLNKRNILYRKLKDNLPPKIGLEDFMEIDFQQEFDNFLYKDVGYDKLNQLTVGLFITPYAATSLREYFASGFEHFFLNDSIDLKKISPFLFSRISSLTNPNLDV